MVSIVGTGNVAWSLAKAFHRQGVRIDAILARNREEGSALASHLNAAFKPLEEASSTSTSILLFCVSDDALNSLISDYAWPSSALIAHTSGPTSIDVLSSHPSHGVFYPLQSMNKAEEPEFGEVPILIEANTAKGMELLQSLAAEISSDVRTMESNARLALHVAAVWANNFVNHLNAEALDLAKQHGVPTDLLQPLIQKTAEIALHGNSAKSQTGPAIRGDESTMEKHLKLLDDRQSEIYRLLSLSIQKNHETEL